MYACLVIPLNNYVARLRGPSYCCNYCTNIYIGLYGVVGFTIFIIFLYRSFSSATRIGRYNTLEVFQPERSTCETKYITVFFDNVIKYARDVCDTWGAKGSVLGDII